MVPDLDLQLQAVIKALSDTVMPALDPANRVAAEQLGLSLATLGMVRARLPLAARREWQALDDMIALGAAVAALGTFATLEAALAAAAVARDAANPLPLARATATQEIAGAVSGIVADGASREVLRAIVAHSRPATDLARAWSLPAGFEPDPEEVPALEKLLGL